MSSRTARPLRLASILTLVALALSLLPVLAHADAGNPPQAGGTYYVVRPGDTWSIVSRRLGVTVADLKKANPALVRPNNWLYIGDRILVPVSPQSGGYWYQVKPGDSWSAISKATGVPVSQLWRANPTLLNPRRWVYIGQKVWIPAPPPASTPSATATPAPIASPQPTASPSPRPASNCPAAFSGYPDAITQVLNTPGNNLDGLRAWLMACGTISERLGAVLPAALRDATSSDVLVALHEPTTVLPYPPGMLLVYHSIPKDGYLLVHKVAAEGKVDVLKSGDLNADGKSDIVWTDTTCGAHTCFSKLHVDSWDGNAYQNWITDDASLASAEYQVQDVAPEGSGAEIIAHGGIIGSVGAGPQRAWTETFISPQGGPYERFTRVYDPSNCLYHHILDANALFDRWNSEGFEPALAAYRAAIDDPQLEACWEIADELNTLRDFARFRVVLALVAVGRADEAAAVIPTITHAALAGATTTFYNAYQTSHSIVQACRDTTQYAISNPASWNFLGDWGYANPPFSAEALCPIR